MKFIGAILLIFITFFLCLTLLTKNYRNPYKLIMVFGKKGSGKSTFLMKQALKYQKKGWTIYTNMVECVMSGVRIIDIKDIGEFIPTSNSVLLLDEVGMEYDNRNYKNFKPATRDFYKLQRHYKVVCYLASQTFDVDLKLRNLTDSMYLCVCAFNVFSIAKKITRKIVLTDSTSEAESRISENLKFKPFWDWSYTFIPKYKKYYDSFIAPPKPYITYTENLQSERKSSDKHVQASLRSMVSSLKEHSKPSANPRPPEALSPVGDPPPAGGSDDIAWTEFFREKK